MKTFNSPDMQPFRLATRCLRFPLGLAILAAVSACGSISPTPTSIVQSPTTVAPVVPVYAPPTTGAIFQSGGYRALFEDGRARHIGDTLIITITENTSTVKAAASSGSKTGGFAIKQPPVLGVFKSLGTASIAGSTSNSFADKDAESASNTFTGTLAVTVTEILPNGNLRVAGEKQLALDKGTEFIRFSGTVNPINIASTNTVTSNQVADARIEYRTNSQVDRASFTAMISRLFASVLPF
jgi:flagellar L-ring protein precursor FlgH